jgi:hypothetical protein
MVSDMPQKPLQDRHPGTQHLMRWLRPNPRLAGQQAFIAEKIEMCALLVLSHTGDGPELTAGLRKLLEAKDCFIRQSIADEP